VTVTWYVPDAVGDMVPAISPLLLIDNPGGRSEAANCADCPSATLGDVTCNWIAVPAASSWRAGSDVVTAAAPGWRDSLLMRFLAPLFTTRRVCGD
jgi:hypothetical protein